MSKAKSFVQKALEWETDDCLIWPYYKTKKGYARAKIDNKVVRLHRYILVKKIGEPKQPKLQACHAPIICTSKACCNPKHLRWATNQENMDDKKIESAHRLALL